jgi:hypothetical protein
VRVVRNTYFILFFFFFRHWGWTLGLRFRDSTSFFIFIFIFYGCFWDRSSGLFAQAGFEPWSSLSLPPKYLGLQMWATGSWLLCVCGGGRGTGVWTQGFTWSTALGYFTPVILEMGVSWTIPLHPWLPVVVLLISTSPVVWRITGRSYRRPAV